MSTRLDQALVERGLCDSREKAKRFILAGQVRINGQSAKKPSDPVREADEVTLEASEKFVSRGGHKLEHALEHFKIEVKDCVAIDLGASTGGFTDCLLQRGAQKVFAVDVGQGQLAWKLRQDSRVVVMEKTNARFLKPEHFVSKAEGRMQNEGVSVPNQTALSAGGGSGAHGVTRPTSSKAVGRNQKAEAEDGAVPPHPNLLPRGGEGTGARAPADLVVADCSFISLTKILPSAIPLVKPGGAIVALIKPQFEAGKAEVDKGRGVITDAKIHERVLAELREFVAAQAGVCWRGVVESPLLGPAGNKEFLAFIEKDR